MKYFNIKLFAALMISIFFFTSCEKEEFEITTVHEIIESVPDTVIVNSEISYRLDNGELQTFNGLGLSCLDTESDEETYVNFIAYGEDLRIEGDQAVFEKDVFTVYWESKTEAELGTFFAFGNIITPTGREILTVVRLEINSFDQTYIQGELFGSFEDPKTDELITYEGSFNLERYDCTIWDDDLPTAEDEGSIVQGTLDIQSSDGDVETYSSVILNCEDAIFPDLEGTKHFMINGLGFILDEDGEVDSFLGLRYMMYHREQEPIEINKTYDVAFGSLSDEIFESLSDGGEDYINSITSTMKAVYTDIGDEFVTGYIEGPLPDGNNFRADFRSQKIECE